MKGTFYPTPLQCPAHSVIINKLQSTKMTLDNKMTDILHIGQYLFEFF